MHSDMGRTKNEHLRRAFTFYLTEKYAEHNGLAPIDASVLLKLAKDVFDKPTLRKLIRVVDSL